MLDANAQSPAALDREAFAQVWRRVSPGEEGPVEPLAPDRPPPGQVLRALTLTCLADAGSYRALSRRAGQSGAVLGRLAEDKTAQAKRLSAALFLRSGVRYWPRDAIPAEGPRDFFSALRGRYLAEEALAAELEALAGTLSEDDAAGLCQALAGETREMARAVRAAVEREM